MYRSQQGMSSTMGSVKRTAQKDFTLIELRIVVAIIGILASAVLARNVFSQALTWVGGMCADRYNFS